MLADPLTRSWSRALVPGDGVSLHVVTARPDVPDTAQASPSMLFVHGFPEFWYAWKDQLAVFGMDRPASALDLRGYGRSDKPPAVEAYAMPHLVADLGAVLDHLSPGRPAVLVAHDWGGVVAWHFAAQFPGRLDKLVIVNAPHPAVFAREILNTPAQRRASAYVALFRSPVAEALLRAGHRTAALDRLRPGRAGRVHARRPPPVPGRLGADGRVDRRPELLPGHAV